MKQLLSLYCLANGHAFTGCDCTSGIFRFGKTTIYEKIASSKKLQNLAERFYMDSLSPEDIGDCSIEIFEIIYSTGDEKFTLPQLRRSKYEEMVASTRTKIDPSCMPPTPRAAHFHGLRCYHQLQVWLKLLDHDIEPTKWGWELSASKLVPIRTDQAPASELLMKIIRCSCKSGCGKRCSCKNAGLKCAPACKECKGITCNNAIIVDESDDDS